MCSLIYIYFYFVLIDPDNCVSILGITKTERATRKVCTIDWEPMKAQHLSPLETCAVFYCLFVYSIRIYKELQTIEDNEFRFREQVSLSTLHYLLPLQGTTSRSHHCH